MYKRQPLECFQSFWIKDCDFAAGEFDETLALKVSKHSSDNFPVAVSYTHLDVYKRQGVNTKKLLKKDNNMVTHPMASSSGAVVPDDGKSAYGLAGFVEEKELSLIHI